METSKLPPEVRGAARRAAFREYARAIRAGETDAVARKIARQSYRTSIGRAAIRKRAEARERCECTACGGFVSRAEVVGLPICNDCTAGAVS